MSFSENLDLIESHLWKMTSTSSIVLEAGSNPGLFRKTVDMLWGVFLKIWEYVKSIPTRFAMDIDRVNRRIDELEDKLASVEQAAQNKIDAAIAAFNKQQKEKNKDIKPTTIKDQLDKIKREQRGTIQRSLAIQERLNLLSPVVERLTHAVIGSEVVPIYKELSYLLADYTEQCYKLGRFDEREPDQIVMIDGARTEFYLLEAYPARIRYALIRRTEDGRPYMYTEQWGPTSLYKGPIPPVVIESKKIILEECDNMQRMAKELNKLRERGESEQINKKSAKKMEFFIKQIREGALKNRLDPEAQHLVVDILRRANNLAKIIAANNLDNVNRFKAIDGLAEVMNEAVSD